jgi:hypothetical protein
MIAPMPRWTDGPASPYFAPWRWTRAPEHDAAALARVHDRARERLATAPSGDCVCRGLAFELPQQPWVVAAHGLAWHSAPMHARWLVFQHAADWPDPATNQYPGRPMPRGAGGLGELLATYVLQAADGAEVRLPVRRRYELGVWETSFGDGVIGALPARKPVLLATQPADRIAFGDFGQTTTGAANSRLVGGVEEWCNWLWAWPNPQPEREWIGLRIEPEAAAAGALFFFGVSAGNVAEHPLQWGARRSAAITAAPGLDLSTLTRRSSGEDAPEAAALPLDIDLGQVLRVQPVPRWPDAQWHSSVAGSLPQPALNTTLLIDYVAHPQAQVHAFGRIETLAAHVDVRQLPPATQRVRLRIVERGRGLPVAARLHVHDGDGRIHMPQGWRRQPDVHWSQDLHADLSWRASAHAAAYVPGEALFDLPPGRVFVEVTKGFEFAPVRRIVEIDAQTETVTIELERVLDWRGRGWTTADTHVHFVSPGTGLLEGAAEDVHLVHLLAAQWGEMFSNVGDFDGGALHRFQGAAGDDAHHLVVGTENRQRVLGHVSLLAYGGPAITPLSTAGSDEGSLGQPQEATLTSWAMQCRAQGGVVVLPHFPNPRLENAAVLAGGLADAVEMGGPFGAWEPQIDAYALADWYRYLNCGLHAPVVGGTDKMSPADAIGAIRTYARLDAGAPFSLDAWREALRRGHTFVSVGALLEFEVEGRPMGARLALPVAGGTLNVHWEVATTGRPVTRVDLLCRGEVVESRRVEAARGSGHFHVHVERSGWLALLVRSQGEGGGEIVSAHSSAVMVDVAGSMHGSDLDALTILEQIEGAIAWMDTLATPVDARRHRALRLQLSRIHRQFHQRMHAAGYAHTHSAPHHHDEHDDDHRH